MKFYIPSLIFFLVAQFSCDNNIIDKKIFVKSNILNSQLKNNDTLMLWVNSKKDLTFKIKTNMKLISILPVKKDISESSKYYFTLKNLTLGKKELFIENHQHEKIKFTILSSKMPEIFDYEILNEFSRSKNNYTQGLEFFNDTLYESLGQYGKSKLIKVDYKNGQYLNEISLPSNQFAEGLTIINNKIIQLTWKEKIGLVYDLKTFKKISSFDYGNSKEGWGICNDGIKLYKSDGTEKIWILNPKKNYFEEDYIEIYTNKNKVVGLNELEWVDGKIYANRYLFEGIAIINPKNGAIEGVINLSNLREKVTQHEKLDVINGIAYHRDRKSFFVTGKMWDKVFEIKILK